MEDADRIFGEDGAVRAMLAAQKAGKVRYIGFTGHKDPAVHLRMLEVAQEHGFHFDAVHMPLNVMDAHFRSFQHEVLPVALREGIGVHQHEIHGRRLHPEERRGQARGVLALCDESADVDRDRRHRQLWRSSSQALEAARTFKPMSRSQVANASRTHPAGALDGRYELFKTSNHFDATAKHPEWLG